MSAPSGKRSIRQIVLDAFPWLEAPAPATYLVGKSDTPGSGLNADGTCNLDPPAGSTLAPLPSVPQWSSSLLVTPAVGSECLVVFRDGDRRRPAIVAFTPIPVPSPGGNVARVGDEATRIAFYPGVPGTVPPSLWVSYQHAAPHTWAKVAETIITGPSPTDDGTPIKITGGSSVVRSA